MNLFDNRRAAQRLHVKSRPARGGRLFPRRLKQERFVEDLSFAADLIATTLQAGFPSASSMRLVGSALGGPVGQWLLDAAPALARGSPGISTDNLPTAAQEHATALVREALRTAENGSALAATFRRHAAQMRTATHKSAEAAARRAGVGIVLPLITCFLPAFGLLGIAPILIGFAYTLDL